MTETLEVDIAIIGAGVVGLAIGEALARNHRSVVILEKEPRIGLGMSSRNSEVIHSGIYYPPHSLKSRHCIRGNQLLYEWCKEMGVRHKKTTKLIVATSTKDEENLERLLKNGQDCGLEGLRILSAKDARQLEPEIVCTKALLCPSSGIVSAHGFMDSLERRFLAQDGTLALRANVMAVEKKSDKYELQISGEKDESYPVSAGMVINAAGLNADLLAELVGIDIDRQSYRVRFCKGNYFRVPGSRGKIDRLIYPLPDPDMASLGIHVTVDLAGEIRLGPDAEWLQDRQEDYKVNENRKSLFLESVKRYWPGISKFPLEPDTVGIRCKREPKEEKGFSDFVIQEESTLGFPGWFDLIGIESPGLTAALSFAEHLSKMDCFNK